jgi:small basic protein
MILFWTLISILIMLGFFAGYLLPVKIPAASFSYLTIVFLSFLDCFFFSMYLWLEEIHSSWRIFLRLILELIFGFFLIYFGDRSGLDLYLVAAIPLGASAFFNFQRLFFK